MMETTGKRKILFVDDEQAILDGIRNVLHRDRQRWDMTFAHGPEAALAAIANESFDVIVSDMRMPGIDGATLLNRVKAESPRTSRIMLSGSADQDEIERATAAVDELLGKPCDARTLRATIERWLPAA
jgi:DNA-binding NtrC family response regulator